ncbi:MAG: hypothetical protein EOP38_01980 [Rubrivivax sp.]|nr:MAG: hypothetical protein EOP38_01980 [Rubrivivax sp.]
MNLFHESFYKFVAIADPDACTLALRELTADLTGSILVAEEGINGMVAGTEDALASFHAALVQDPRLLDPQGTALFDGMGFKRSACRTRPFFKMKVHRKPEILPLGVDGVDARRTGINLKPQAWRELIAQDDVVLIDNRNSFEYKLGRFKNAVDPQVHHFRDLPKYIEEHVDAWKAEGKRVAMYCTGGIRCEKTSAWMLDMEIPVYQLEGGILTYFAEMPDADKDWEGECFVFDNRIALDTHLQQTDTTAEDVYAGDPDELWRLQRAKRLSKGGK